MATQTFPGVHTTTTGYTQTRVQPQIRFDEGVIRTKDGAVKIICIVLNLLGFISIQCSDWSWIKKGEYFSSISMIAFFFTLFMLIFYLFHVLEKLYRIPWILIDLVFCGIWTILYLIAAILAATVSGSGAFIAAAFFGFCAMLAYGFNAYLNYMVYRAGGIAQGSRSIQTSQQVTTVTVQ